MSKSILCVVIAAAIAAVVTFLPASAPQSVVGTAVAETARTDGLSPPGFSPTCASNAWPYYDQGCLRGRTGGPLPPRNIRVLR